MFLHVLKNCQNCPICPKKLTNCPNLSIFKGKLKIANLVVVSIITMIRLETLYPKNAVIDRLRSKYAFEDNIFCGGGQGGQGGQGQPEENRTERYLTPVKEKSGFFSRWQRDHFSAGDEGAQEVEKYALKNFD